jgi:hypothetical protein
MGCASGQRLSMSSEKDIVFMGSSKLVELLRLQQLTDYQNITGGRPKSREEMD